MGLRLLFGRTGAPARPGSAAMPIAQELPLPAAEAPVTRASVGEALDGFLSTVGGMCARPGSVFSGSASQRGESSTATDVEAETSTTRKQRRKTKIEERRKSLSAADSARDLVGH